MDNLLAAILMWVVHVVIALIIFATISYRERNRQADWHVWELSAFVLPYLIWVSLMFSTLSRHNKGVGNLLELPLLGVAVGLAASKRIALKNKNYEAKTAYKFLAALCALAVGLFFCVPAMSE